MKSIGIRVEPSEIYYTIVESDENSNFNFVNQKLVLPKAFNNDIPKQLSFVRTTLFSIICEYDIKYAGLKTTEGSALQPSVFRMNVEGVIQELFADSTIQKYFTGTYTSVASRLKTTSTIIKDNCNGVSNILGINEWGKIKTKHRECILAALASINFNIEVNMDV
ncbi:hypothetical protein [Peribacillus loiseleuriae]|uniref:Uncharacterized protein n=1 Tax=Peribacillus loiseleuriae TaxID=1679170 RepID=A0A0K9GV39_9BACI|nr:hypothetical protein [Peribacillus loiseleuriae]KMY50554.1 hypothetical protein AC625_14430 [Peribacillus loiseleuriae]